MAKCGQCDFKGGMDEYLKHTCKSGFRPDQPENLGESFKTVSKAALERGEARKKKT